MTPPPLAISDSLGKVIEKIQLDSQLAAEKMLDLQPAALIVFSHLRWEFVTQRPQHIMTRLAKHHHIYFVEEPVVDEAITTDPKTYQAARNITVVQPRQHNREAFLAEWLHAQADMKASAPIVWFYSAAFINMSSYFENSMVVYDCMDELTAFKGANPILRAQEQQLMNMADVVFTGGKSLFQAKQRLHHNVHCFPSSVDEAHFAKALQARTNVPKDIEAIPGPKVGFYGVIDERMDIGLLGEIAQAAPQISFVMMGPVVKIDPADLPRFPNLYYLGAKEYQVLPNYLKALDITFMPFALNEATTFISPTKTLEFMAAEKAIISTPIHDVVADYKHVVSICRTASDFVSAIQSYLMETPAEKRVRVSAQQQILSNTSWDKTVQSMRAILQRTLFSKQQYQAWSSELEVTVQPVPSTVSV